MRADVLEREVTDLQLRNEELTSLAQEAQSLKDEMDILRSETRDASLSAVRRSLCVPHRCFLLQALVRPRQSPGGHGGDVQAQAGGSGRSAQTGASAGGEEPRVHAAHLRAGGGAAPSQRHPLAARQLQETGEGALTTTHRQHEDEQSVFITSLLIITFDSVCEIYLYWSLVLI